MIHEANVSYPVFYWRSTILCMYVWDIFMQKSIPPADEKESETCCPSFHLIELWPVKIQANYIDVGV